MTIRLHVNIDHVATVRNARGTFYPDPVLAAAVCERAGADGITAHLREDRRHIVDRDVDRLREHVTSFFNLEMAATDEMLAIALKHRPHAACLVPEKREERTTEGGLDVVRGHNMLRPYVAQLGDAGIRVSLFIEPDRAALDAAVSLGAPVVELHTGAYCEAWNDDPVGARTKAQLQRLVDAAAHAHAVGLECHAGHGLSFDTVGPVAAIATIMELNIGHFLVGEAIFSGLESAIKRMRALMDTVRAESHGQKSA